MSHTYRSTTSGNHVSWDFVHGVISPYTESIRFSNRKLGYYSYKVYQFYFQQDNETGKFYLPGGFQEITDVHECVLKMYEQMMGQDNLDDTWDGDGYLTFSEAKAHYQFGGGSPVYVDLSKIDLSNVTMSDFGKNERALVQLDGKHFSNLNDALVHGTITLQRIKNTNTATIAGSGYGMYDFDMHPWNNLFNTFVRNPATIAGYIINSLVIIHAPIPIAIPIGGTPYPIFYTGTTTINP